MHAAMRSTRPLCCVSVRVLRAYIYNALFTTAKPPKIRLPPLYLGFRPPSSILAPIPSVVLLRSSSFLVSFSPGVTVSFIRASQLTDTALCPFVSLLIPFIPLIPSPSSHLRVLALTSRFSFVPVIDTRVNERDDWVLNKFRLMWHIFILAMSIHACGIILIFILFIYSRKREKEEASYSRFDCLTNIYLFKRTFTGTRYKTLLYPSPMLH